jgi:flagellar basal body-associated protein FliL
MIPYLIIAIVVPSLGWLVLHFAKQATKERERADYNEATAKEVKRQAEIIGEHTTDADTVSRLRKLAADKRKRETKG